MPIVITTKGRRLSDVELTSKDLMREVGLLARERILRRTASGLDQDERPFALYSYGYAMLKFKEVGKISPVDLQVSHGMLGAIDITDLTERTVTLGFK